MNFPRAALYISVMLLSLTLAVSAQQSASAQPSTAVPRLVKYSGVLKDAAGKPRSGTVGLTLAIYAEQEGGAALWLETQNAELDDQGRYTVLLGAQTKDGLPLELFTAGEARWLGVQVNLPGEVEQPRVLLVSVPYALKAADAETLGGKSVSAFVLAAGPSDASSGGKGVAPRLEAILAGGAQGVTATTSGGTVNFLAKFDSTGTNLVNSSISDNGSRISIAEGVDFSSDFSFVGNANPAATGRVQLFDRAFQGFVIRGLNIIFETLQPTATEVLRISQSGRVQASGNTTGVNASILQVNQAGLGISNADINNPPPAAVRGDATGLSQVTTGVLGRAVSPDGIGVVGGNDSATGTGFPIGVFGTIRSGDGAGVYGEVLQTGNVSNTGVIGLSASSFGNGVWGQAIATSGPAWGVLGTTSSLSGVAGVFDNGAGGDILVGQVNGVRRFRVDATGRGFFNNGTQVGGADFAESLGVLGDAGAYEPGDVLVIDVTGDRRVALSQRPYSALVAGIYSTKPGVLATPHEMDDPRLVSNVPLAIVGIVPCKVSAENGPISRGDLLVTSSVKSHAMKGTDLTRMLGAIVGKALEPFDPRDAQGRPIKNATGVIQVLVTLQ